MVGKVGHKRRKRYIKYFCWKNHCWSLHKRGFNTLQYILWILDAKMVSTVNQYRTLFQDKPRISKCIEYRYFFSLIEFCLDKCRWIAECFAFTFCILRYIVHSHNRHNVVVLSLGDLWGATNINLLFSQDFSCLEDVACLSFLFSSISSFMSRQTQYYCHLGRWFRLWRYWIHQSGRIDS